MIRGTSSWQLVHLLIACLALVGAAMGSEEPAGIGPEEQRLLSKMAVEGTNAATLYALADHCHDLGVDGSKEAVVRAERYLRQLLKLEPENARALALLGSVYTMKGRDAFWPPTQLRLVREGNTYMDKAVNMAPDAVAPRVIRALNNAHMPDFLGRREVVREDLSWLWPKVEKDPEGFTLSQRQNLALHWGRQLKRMRQPDEARRVWEIGRNFDPNTKASREISAELAKLE
jgi:hypothetical protein